MPVRWLTPLMLFALVLLASGCASGPVAGQVPPGQPLPSPSAGDFDAGSEYRLGAQDLLKVSVFGVEELDRTVRVNADGQISMPLIGGVMAGGRSIPELEAELARRYGDGFLQQPQVSVFVEEYASQRITVAGAVEDPGIYPLTGRTTLLQAIALADGLDPLADLGGVIVFREVGGRRMAAVYDMRELRRGRIADPQLYGNDMVIVEQSGSKTAFRRIIESIPVLGLFRIY